MPAVMCSLRAPPAVGSAPRVSKYEKVWRIVSDQSPSRAWRGRMFGVRPAASSALESGLW